MPVSMAYRFPGGGNARYWPRANGSLTPPGYRTASTAGIIMRARRRMAGDQRQWLLGALQRPDLALLIDRQGVVGRIDIQPDHVAHLVDEGGVARDLETLDQMRLQAVLTPDLLDGGLAQANCPGQAARAPVCGVRRHRALRSLHHRAHLVRPDRRRPP